MEYSKDDLKKILKDIIKGLEGVIENADEDDDLEYDFYATLLPEELIENYDYEGNSPDDYLGESAIKYPELHPLMRQVVALVTEVNNTIDIMWIDDESHAAGGIARELALANKDDVLLYARYLSSNDLNHEVYQAEDIDAILEKWGSCRETYALAAARWFTPGQHKREQGLEDAIEVNDEKAADALIAAAAQWFTEGWFEPYSPKQARRDYFEAHVKGSVEEFFEMFLADFSKDISAMTDRFTDLIYKSAKAPTLKELLISKETAYLKDVPDIQEAVPAIIDKDEWKKRGLDKVDVEKETQSKFFLFYDHNIPNPFIRSHIEEQWEALNDLSVNGQRWNHYRSLCLKSNYKEYYVDLVNVPCNYGLVLYDGKNAPIILYGILDYVAVIKKYFGKRHLGNTGKLEGDAKRKEIKEAEKKYVMFLPPAQIKKEIKMPKSEAHYDELNDSIIIDKDYDKALKLINSMDKNAPEYPASVMDKMIVMEAKENWAEAIKACDELIGLVPELAEYWAAEREKFNSKI